MRRNTGQRAAACLLALLAQAGLIALFMQSRAPRPDQDHDSGHLIFVLPFQSQLPPSVSILSTTRRRANIRAVVVERSEPLQSPEDSPVAPESPSAFTPSTAAPGIDWYAQGEREAAKAADRLENRELHGNLLDSKPRVLVIPERPHRPGDEEHYPDGAVLTWLSERCYVMLDPSRSGPRPFKVCKEPTLAERRAEANRRQREQAMMPGYIRKAVPKPAPR
jgi:hypothetical protein